MDHELEEREPLSRLEARQVFNRIGLGLFLYMMTQTASANIIQLAVYFISPAILEQDWFFMLLVMICQYVIAFPVLWRVWRTIPDRVAPSSSPMRLGGKGYVMLVPVCCATIFVLNRLSGILAQFLSQVRGDEITNSLEEVLSGSNLWMNFLVLVIVGPIMEEIIFRRLLYNKLSCFGGGVYVWFGSLLFAAFHVNIYQMLYAFALGVIFSTITYRTGTIRHAVILHMAVNFMGGGASPLIAHYLGDRGLVIWGNALVTMLIVGVIVIVWLGLRACREWLPYEPGPFARPGAAQVLLTPGMLLLTAAVVWYTFF